jgi:3-deoxy-D-manno-octulosonic acid kinase
VRPPDGYTALRRWHVRALVRTDLVTELAPWLLASRLEVPSDSQALRGGRGAAHRVRLPGGIGAVLRYYRRGGWLARVVRESYLGSTARPFRELAVTAEARRRGVAAAEVLAARVEGWITYRGAIVTAEVPEAVPVIEALRDATDDRRRALATAVARVVADMHRAGVFHADLNLTNLVTRGVAGGPDVTILDFDRARIGRAPLVARARHHNLRRLARSLRKLDPTGRLAAPDDVAAFHAAYANAMEAPCAS